MKTEFKTPAQFLGKSIQKTCNECGKQFAFFFPSLAHLVHTCPECSEAHAMEESRAVIQRGQAMNIRAQQWAKICPEIFHDTNPEHPKFPREILARVMRWKFGPKGMIFTGPTGKCKSRCAWMLLKREFIEGGKHVEAIDHSVAFEYGEAFTKSGDASKWVNNLNSADILFLDDVFKAKLTESLEQALFTIISHRTEHKKPIICTLNDTGATLIARMSEDRGKALVRRLGEFCEVVAFGEQKESK